MNNPRTLIATIGATAAGFALVLASVIFNAASASPAAAVASAGTGATSNVAASSQVDPVGRYAFQFNAETGEPC